MQAEKIIAEKAAKLIKDGDIIFLEQSSSTFFLADEIKNRESLTVVTNSIEIVRLLSDSKIKIIYSGGVLSNDNRVCLVGADAEEVFKNINADIMFFSSKSLDYDGTISDCTREEVLIRKPMLKNAIKKVFLCDSEKFGTRSAYIQCSLSDIDYLVSEDEKAKIFTTCNENLIII